MSSVNEIYLFVFIPIVIFSFINVLVLIKSKGKIESKHPTFYKNSQVIFISFAFLSILVVLDLAYALSNVFRNQINNLGNWFVSLIYDLFEFFRQALLNKGGD